MGRWNDSMEMREKVDKWKNRLTIVAGIAVAGVIVFIIIRIVSVM
jgi:hypothetical protein